MAAQPFDADHRIVIHLADAALAAWFAAIDPDVEVIFEPGEEGSGATTLTLLLAAVREQTSKRSTEAHDVRDDDGRVVARQRATRFFELDYICTATGPPLRAHEILGQVVQLMVDHDVVPVDHVPTALLETDEPVEVSIVAPDSAVAARAAALTLRLVMPVQPTAEREIAPPVDELRLDLAPAPNRAATPGRASDGAAEPVPDREWTTVRRRERITPGTTVETAEPWD